MAKVAILCQGLPASGKSSYARDLIRREPGKWKNVCRDDIRNMLDDGAYSADNEEFARKIRDQLIIAVLRDGHNIICSDTNLVPQTVKKLHRLFENVGDVKVVHMPFNVSIAECVRRNELREGKAKVPQDVIHKMAKAAGIDRGRMLEAKETYYPPKEQIAAKYEGNAEAIKAAVIDVDGTIAILNGNRSPYDASKSDVLDAPNTPVIDLVRLLYNSGHRIVFCSGRKERDREPTVRFIEKHIAGIEYELFMRRDNDDRKDALIKEEIFEEHIRPRYNVRAVIDDRLQVCRLWYRLGLPILRVGDPDATF